MDVFLYSKPCRFFALNICRYRSRCYFRHEHIHKSQDWAERNFKTLEQKINEQIQKQLEFHERMGKKLMKYSSINLNCENLVKIYLSAQLLKWTVTKRMNRLHKNELQNQSNSKKKTQVQRSILQSPVHPDEQKLCRLSNCKKQAKLRCTKCKKTYYCSPKHQAEHWKCHKKQCGQDARADFEFSENTF